MVQILCPAPPPALSVRLSKARSTSRTEEAGNRTVCKQKFIVRARFSEVPCLQFVICSLASLPHALLSLSRYRLLGFSEPNPRGQNPPLLVPLARMTCWIG